MAGNISKIYQRTAFIMLAIIIFGLFNVCWFAFPAKAAPMQPLNFSLAYNNGDCVAEPRPEPGETMNRPAAPMPECCLARNRYYDAVVNAANDKAATTFSGPVILLSNKLRPENNFIYYTTRLTYPPPAALALASIVIRE